MRKFTEAFLALALLAYGLIRLAVGSALLGQELGLIDVEGFRGPIEDIGAFLDKSEDKQLIPVSVTGYVAYIASMGVVLSIGAIGTLKNWWPGLLLIGAFLMMYALLFVNFQTINPKAIHLGVCAAGFLVLLWLKDPFGRRSESHA